MARYRLLITLAIVSLAFAAYGDQPMFAPRDPGAARTGDLDDLSGVTDASTARSNLDVYSKAETSALIPNNASFTLAGLSEKSYSSLTGKPSFGTMASETATNYVATSTLTAHENDTSTHGVAQVAGIADVSAALSAANASDALNLRLDGSRAMTGNLKFAGGYGIFRATNDGADNSYLWLSGGGGLDPSRGGCMSFFGNEYPVCGGQVNYYAGNVSGGDHVFYTGAGTERFRIGYDGTITASSLSVGATPIFRDSSGYFSNAIEVGVDNGDTYPIRFQIDQDTGTTYLNSNLYYSGGFKCYDVNRAAASINMTCTNADSSIRFLTHNVNNTTPNTRATITKLGNLLIGTTTDDGTNKLQVNGGAKIAGTIESTGAATVGGDLTVTGASTNFRNAIKAVDGAGSGLDADTVPNATPASAGAAGTAGMIRYDANYIYICVAANTWKRAAISTW